MNQPFLKNILSHYSFQIQENKCFYWKKLQATGSGSLAQSQVGRRAAGSGTVAQNQATEPDLVVHPPNWELWSHSSRPRVPMTSAPFTKFYKNLLTKSVSLLYNTINKLITVVLQ